jgi:AcrR family transcriptional regulator
MLTDTKRRNETPGQPEAAYLNPDDPPSKRKILQTALRLFALYGLDAVTVRQIAGEAGYTNPALFKFFPTKDALALYLFECCYLELFEALKVGVGDSTTFDEGLEAVFRVFFSQLERDLDAFLFVQDHLRQMWPKVPVQTRKKSILGLIQQVLRRGMDEGVVRGANPDLLVAAITGTLQQFARLLYFGEFKGKPSDWRQELNIIIKRIVAPQRVRSRRSS